MADSPTNEEVLAAVEKAGWLLEQKAVRILESSEFSPRPGWAFQDPDKSDSSRELDVWAYRRFLHDPDSKVVVAGIILVECKQTASPFCAVGRELPEWQRQGNPTEHVLPAPTIATKIGPNAHRNEPAWDKLGFRDLALKFGFSNFRANQLTRLDRPKGDWVASNADIFTSLVFPLAKAIIATQAIYGNPGYSKVRSPTSANARQDYLSFYLLFPTVLISSELYVVDAEQDEPQVSKANWVRAQRQIETSSVSGIFEFDVVAVDNFKDYLDSLVIPFCEAISTRISGDPYLHTDESPPGE